MVFPCGDSWRPIPYRHGLEGTPAKTGGKYCAQRGIIRCFLAHAGSSLDHPIPSTLFGMSERTINLTWIALILLTSASYHFADANRSTPWNSSAAALCFYASP